MDPITGVIALGGLGLASLMGLRLKKNMQEGFKVLPYVPEDEKGKEEQPNSYPSSVADSQSRYNDFSNMINPLNNSIIPVGSDKDTIDARKNDIKLALGSSAVGYTGEVLNLKNLRNKYNPRSDSNRSLFAAMKFCRETAATNEKPFSVRDEKNDFDFAKICGICLTRGFDEEGKGFNASDKPQGMLLDPDTRETAYQERDQKGLPFARVKPSLGTCEGAPDQPAFATNEDEFRKFKGRIDCAKIKSLDTDPDWERIADPIKREQARKAWQDSLRYCGLCWKNDSYSYVGPEPRTNSVFLVMRGIGNATISVRDRDIQTVKLSDTSNTRVELVGIKEGDPFSVRVTSENPSSQSATLYGYLESANGNGGQFLMELNLLFTVDDRTGQAPFKAGTFYTFEEVKLLTAKLVTGRGVVSERNKPDMNLRAVLPFTFVQASEFSAIDCPTAPFQVRQTSANAFSTDQPCFAPGTKKGNYNNDCLKERIGDSGCTNAGELWKNPQQLNKNEKGEDQSLEEIYNKLKDIASKNMIDAAATKLCSGKDIRTPCDVLLAEPDLKLGPIIKDQMKERANLIPSIKMCMSYIYDNEGAKEQGPDLRVGPTYSGLVRFMNNQRVRKNIYCLPEGKLNPNHQNPGIASAALTSLIEKYDGGYARPDKPQQRFTGVEAVKQFLNYQLEYSVDQTVNANTTPDKKAAIEQCFGDKINLPDFTKAAADTTTKRVFAEPCGVLARFVRVLPSLLTTDNWIEIAQIVVIDANGNNVARQADVVSESTPAYVGNPQYVPAKAIDGVMVTKVSNFYASATPGSQNPNTQFFMDLRSNVDITKIIFYSRGDAQRIDNQRKNGIRVQLLDANRRVIRENRLNAALVEEIDYLAASGFSGCKNTLATVQQAPVIPPGFQPGLFCRFSRLVQGCSPGRDPNSFGWGRLIGTGAGYTTLHFRDNYWPHSPFTYLPQGDFIMVVARGYYFASGPGILDLGTWSDDGVIVLFNNRPVIDNWTLHGPTRDESPTIEIPAAGQYPIELRFFECGGGAQISLDYKVNDRAGQWQGNLAGFFAFNPAEEQMMQANYQARATAMYPWS